MFNVFEVVSGRGVETHKELETIQSVDNLYDACCLAYDKYPNKMLRVKDSVTKTSVQIDAEFTEETKKELRESLAQG